MVDKFAVNLQAAFHERQSRSSETHTERKQQAEMVADGEVGGTTSRLHVRTGTRHA